VLDKVILGYSGHALLLLKRFWKRLKIRYADKEKVEQDPFNLPI
jgi:hypothetical protein